MDFVKFSCYEFDNGFRIMFLFDDLLSFVVVNFWYYVGLKNECFGFIGFVYFFEYMFF